MDRKLRPNLIPGLILRDVVHFVCVFSLKVFDSKKYRSDSLLGYFEVSMQHFILSLLTVNYGI